jgi:heterodisulfide reductase subunit A
LTAEEEKKKSRGKRVGVFVCHCGMNIAETVDVEKVVEEVEQLPDVVYATDVDYLCSEPGQKTLKEGIRDNKLDGVICACCSPVLHEETFKRALEAAGANRYELEIANIREKCSWVHDDREKATEKATKIVKSKIAKSLGNESLKPISVSVDRKCMVIGGGVTGIQAALDLADTGIQVYLVEKQPSIGGHMAQLSVTFPTLDCSQCILSPKLAAVANHPNIELLTNSEVTNISGYVGNFHVEVTKHPRFVIEGTCNLCGDCEEACPVSVPDEFEGGMSPRKAIYLPFPQAIPSVYTLDPEACLGLNPLVCSKCKDVCETEAINYDMGEEKSEIDVGAIIIATGYDLYDVQEKIPEYEYGPEKDIIHGLQFERLIHPAGPSSGSIVRPSDHKKPETLVFVQCVGSRDPENHMAYCSKICCTYIGKQAMIYKNRNPDKEVYVFYIDVRASGRGYEEFIQRSQNAGVIYIRGKPSKIFREGDKVMVWAANTLTGERLEIEADMVVYAPALRPNINAKKLARITKLTLDEYGFFKEAHMKLRPVESIISGIFLAGTALSPKDIPESVAQGSAAASKAFTLLSKPELIHDPIVCQVDDQLCTGCKVCQGLCPYGAISFNENKNISVIEEVLCMGCGTCVSACPSGAMTLRNISDEQINDMISVITERTAIKQVK